jgi:hypothetical protein
MVAWNDAGIANRPFGIVQITVGPLFPGDGLAAIGAGQSCAIMDDQEVRLVESPTSSDVVRYAISSAMRADSHRREARSGIWQVRAARY